MKFTADAGRGTHDRGWRGRARARPPPCRPARTFATTPMTAREHRTRPICDDDDAQIRRPLPPHQAAVSGPRPTVVLPPRRRFTNLPTPSRARMDRPSGVASTQQNHPVVLGFASRAERTRAERSPLATPLLSTTSCPSSPLTRGLRESAFSLASDKSRASEALQETPRSGADSGDSGAAGHSSGDEQDAPRMPAACLERTLSGSMPVCIPGDRRRCEARAVGRHLLHWGFRLASSRRAAPTQHRARQRARSEPTAPCNSHRSPGGLPGALAAAIARPTVSCLACVTDSGTRRRSRLGRISSLSSAAWAAWSGRLSSRATCSSPLSTS